MDFHSIIFKDHRDSLPLFGQAIHGSFLLGDRALLESNRAPGEVLPGIAEVT